MVISMGEYLNHLCFRGNDCCRQARLPDMQLRLLKLPVCRWVSAAICQQYGIADCAADAWNEAGAGKFSFKIDKSGE